ncbi:sensor histidine kinase [Actibacterium mucosum]|nr:HAMP domain-containing sensor histidine kinase [Actibacterium mucosum]
MLTIVFVMLAEVMIFVPSIARFREDFLLNRLERAQIASLAVLASSSGIEMDLEDELLKNAGVFNVVLRRDQSRQLALSSSMPASVTKSFDLRDAGPMMLIRDAVARVSNPENELIRVIGQPVNDAGLLIEVTMFSEPLRVAMIDYGLRIFWLSLVISVITAVFLFLAVQRLMVAPIQKVISAMRDYAEAPEDARRIISPESAINEIHEAETALQTMEQQLSTALRQKERLAQLGGAVAKISHDLRNILTTAQLFADRMERSQDPAVAKSAPKIVGAISRAVSLCENTLAFGKAEEPAPRLSHISLAPLVNDVVDSERLAAGEAEISFSEDVPAGMALRADPEQLYRVISNLTRNARQAIEATGKPGEICIQGAEEDLEWLICIRDTGPGLPPKAHEHLFKPFQGSFRKGGTGLGLTISSELIRGHGGRLELAETGAQGTAFTIRIPKGEHVIEAQAK